MSKNPRPTGVAAICKALGDTLREASDQEIREDLKALKIDLGKADQQMKFALDGAVDHFYANRWKATRERNGQTAESCAADALETAARSPDQCRQLLAEVLTQSDSARSALAIELGAISDVNELSDAEVMHLFRYLVSLGLLDVSRLSTR